MDFERLDSMRKIFLLPLAFVLRAVGFFLRQKNNGRAIVVFYTGKLGDMVCLTPVLETLKKSNPDAALIVFARSKFLDIWQDNPFIDAKIGFANEREAGGFRWLIRQWRYLCRYEITQFFNLVNNFEGGVLGLAVNASFRYFVTTALDGRLNRLLYPHYSTREYKFDYPIKEFYFDLLKDAGCHVANTSNQLFFPGVCEEVEDFFQRESLSGKTVIGAIISSGKDYKVWPSEYWLELMKRLQAEYQPVFLLFGLPEDKEKLEKIKIESGCDIRLILGKDLKVLPHYIKKCRLFVSVDTGLMYIADALKVPVVDILGPCDDNNQRPENNFRLVTDRQVCRPQCKMLYSGKIDLNEVEACFAALTPETVIAACQELLPPLD